MTAGTVVLWRHGQTAWNAQRRLQGQADVDLDDVGIAQAVEGARALAPMRPAAIASSDLVRARRTAQALGDVVGVPVAVDERLRERAFGAWEGLDHAELESGWPEEYRAWSGGVQPEGIGLEPRAAVGKRVAESIEAHSAPLDSDDVLVVVTHGAALSAGITHMLGLDPDEWNGLSGVGNCHWSLLHPTRSGRPPWRLFVHNVAPT